MYGKKQGNICILGILLFVVCLVSVSFSPKLYHVLVSTLNTL